jgi:hypothetical protein
MKPFITSIVRHLLSALAGSLIALGIAENHANSFLTASEPIVSGILIYIIAQAASFAKVNHFKALADRFGFKI